MALRAEPWTGRPDLDIAGAWTTLDRICPSLDPIAAEQLLNAAVAGAREGWAQRKARV